MIHMTYRPYIHVKLVSFKCLFRHLIFPLLKVKNNQNARSNNQTIFNNQNIKQQAKK